MGWESLGQGHPLRQKCGTRAGAAVATLLVSSLGSPDHSQVTGAPHLQAAPHKSCGPTPSHCHCAPGTGDTAVSTRKVFFFFLT